MNPGPPGKIRRNGRFADLPDAEAALESRVRFKPGKVGAEEDRSSRPDQPRRLFDKLPVIPLNIEIPFTVLRVGVGRGIDVREIETFPRAGRASQKLKHISGYETVIPLIEFIEAQVLASPVKVAFRGVDAEARGRSSRGGGHGGCTGIGEEVQEGLSLNLRPYNTPEFAAVGEEPRVQVIGEIDVETEVFFAADSFFPLVAPALVAVAAAEPAPFLDENSFRPDFQKLNESFEGLPPAAAYRARVDSRGGRVLLQMAPGIVVQVDGEGVLGHVLVVEPVGARTTAFQVGAQPSAVFAQAVDEHLCSVGNPVLFNIRVNQRDRN